MLKLDIKVIGLLVMGSLLLLTTIFATVNSSQTATQDISSMALLSLGVLSVFLGQFNKLATQS